MASERKVLVSGGCGFIGSHTVVELVNNGYSTVVVDNLSNSTLTVLDRVKQLTGKPETITFVQLDLCDEQGLRKVFQEHKIEAVIHFAALKAVNESKQIPLTYYEKNMIGTINLLKVMSEFHVKQLIFSSSCTVYGVQPSPLDEAKPTSGGTNAYAQTKYMAEMMLKEMCACDPSWSVCILRYFNPVAAHPSGLIGEDPRGTPQGLLPYALQAMVGRQKELVILGNDYETRDGTCIRDFIHVVDLAAGHIAALSWLQREVGARLAAGKPPGVIDIFNLGTGTGTTVMELVVALGKAAGKPVPHRIGARRDADLVAAYANPEKALSVLGWRTKLNIDDMCRDAWNWQSNNPFGYDTPK